MTQPARLLARRLEAKDAYTQGHSDRVSVYAVAIARELGLSEAMQREIALAGELHDVGKMVVPLAILTKPGRLTEAEYRRLMRHPVDGERLLATRFAHRPTVLAVARWHHERYDGKGLPDGLAGEAIPLAARIVAVADAFDAMTSSRPYRAALPLAVAIREIERHAGTQFDPVCARAFLAVLRRRGQGRGGVPVAAFRRAVQRLWYGRRGGRWAQGRGGTRASHGGWGGPPTHRLRDGPARPEVRRCRGSRGDARVHPPPLLTTTHQSVARLRAAARHRLWPGRGMWRTRPLRY